MWSDMPCAVPLFFHPAVCSDHTGKVLDRKGYPTGESLWSLTFGSCYQVWPKGFVSRLLHACSSSQTPQGWEEKYAFQGGFKATYSLWHGVENFIPLEWPAWTYIIHMFPRHSQVKKTRRFQTILFVWLVLQFKYLTLTQKEKTTYKTTCLLPVQIWIHSVKTGNKLEVV